MAIRAWIREIAGGPPPKTGRVRLKSEAGRREASLRGAVVRKALGVLKDHHEFEPYDDDHPYVRLLDQPNALDVAYDLWAYSTLFLKLTGEAHWWLMRHQVTRIPVEVWVIPTHWMRLLTDSEGRPLAYEVQSPWGRMADVPFGDVVSFRDHSPLNRYEGHSVSQAIGEWIDSYESLIRFRLAVWKNGAVPSFHIALGGSYQDPDEAFLSRFYARWFQRFQGEDRSGLPVITGPDVEIRGLDGHRPADALAASDASEEHIRDQTLAAYEVPKAAVGLVEGMTYGSVEGVRYQFREFSVNSLLSYMGQVITHKVQRPTPGWEDGVTFWDKRLPDDPDYLLRKQDQHLRNGVMSVNEARTEDGREPWPYGGDDPSVQSTGSAQVGWYTGKKPEELDLNQAQRLEQGKEGGGTPGVTAGPDGGAGGVAADDRAAGDGVPAGRGPPAHEEEEEKQLPGAVLRWHRTPDGGLEARGRHRWYIERGRDARGQPTGYALHLNGAPHDQARAVGLLKQIAEEHEGRADEHTVVRQALGAGSGAGGGYLIPQEHGYNGNGRRR